ncbi:YhgE/Pip domain-containing protein [Actinoplanes sp. Pm04-4]|uniref:YhgE/Pip domain-containing protein n=1 Tax=Paractinoplanes pyxinae TaxID=2997416 RepID=A0ABT4B566_9ACTN|nr:YhgE/Pip domain-containing protein [Actinoplanes pyxinae]MCY1141633.1 YhgE/Pip domain-containing protein [Actinoplanes pyxinae]
MTSALRRLSRPAILLIPVLVATSLLAAFDSPADHLSTVRAAVVNNDEPVEIDGKTVPLGRELAGRLVNHTGDNYTWVLTDPDDATAGLKTGEYAVAVTIPQYFSRAATSTAGDDPNTATQARIDVTASRTTNAVDPIITKTLTDAAVDALNRTVVETYLDNIYLGFNTMHEQLGDAADGAGKLSDGAGQLADGSNQLVVGLGRLADGSTDLATGLDQLDTGSQNLADGIGRLNDGATELATRTRQLSNGAATLATGTTSLTTGTRQVADGADTLATGLDTLDKSVTDLPAQTHQLAGGAQQVADGNQELADTVVPLADKAIDGIDALPDLTAEAERAEDLAAQCETPASLCQQLQAIAEQLVADAQQAETAKSDVRGQVVAVKTNITDLADGAQQVADGTAELAEQTPQLVSAIGQAATGADQLANGADQAATGAAQVDTGAHRLASGAEQLAAGAGRLATGADDAADGADQLAAGTAEAADGADDLTSGARQADSAGQQLADGSDRLADGAGELVSSLDDGRDQVPTYTAADRDHLKTVAATPVTADLHDFGDLGGLSAAAIIVIALWIGAMLILLITPATRHDPLTWHGPIWQLAIRNARQPALLALAQALLVTGAAEAFLTRGAIDLLALLTVDILVSVTFVMINQALVVAFGNRGRIVATIVPAVVLATAAVAGIPGWLTTLDNLLPGYGPVLAIRAITADAGLGPTGIAYTLLWLGLGAAGYLLAISRRRTSRVLVWS